jgi:hypothetical protein
MVSVLLLLTVFSLPLHSHPSETTGQVTKECSCIHGTRTEIGATPAPVDSTPSPEPLIYEFFPPELSSRLIISFGLIRAPPVL